MFDVFCPRHRSRVLLAPDNIVELVNRPGAIELHWRCRCGERGMTRVHRDGAPLVATG